MTVTTTRAEEPACPEASPDAACTGAPSPGWGFSTLQIHAGRDYGAHHRAVVPPIYASTAFDLGDVDNAAELFAMRRPGVVYSRTGNPTHEVVEARLAALEHGSAALLVASGQAAVAVALLTLVQAGGHVVASSSLYGGTYALLTETLAPLGIETTFVEDTGDPAAWRAAVRPETRVLYAESLPNPQNDVLDFGTVAAVAHEAGVPLVVDNTVATPYLIRPLDLGADVVVHSATKFLAGHGAAVAGAIVEAGRFDWAAHRDAYPAFSAPNPGYGGLVPVEAFPDSAFTFRARAQYLRDLGPALSPLHSFALAQGLDTLSLRMARHVANARTLAAWLDARPEVTRVHYAGLPGNPHHALAERYAPRGTGSVFGFELAGGFPAARAFIDALELFTHAANIGDVRSLVVHPATTTHVEMPSEALARAGVTPGLVRLSVGLEDSTDLIADLERGFAAVARM